ncbi:MAG: phosphoribosyl-ATP diphosphatase [Oscillospiraceae bacterium]|jgi:phosphoribosyl-ATP pyrophosphohydrolase|nr:phosphoribosyl-ATP diphosphatase [Oscillospiraceae bacterium]
MNDSNAISSLYKVVLDRKRESAEGSYTRYLFEQGLDKILKKLGEECAETIISAKNYERGAYTADSLVGEVGDLLYHLLVMLAQLDVPLESVLAELDARALKQGNLKPMKTVDKNT